MSHPPVRLALDGAVAVITLDRHDVLNAFDEPMTAGLSSAVRERDLGELLDLEADLQDRAGRSRDYAEGVRAFLERRRASFEGR